MCIIKYVYMYILNTLQIVLKMFDRHYCSQDLSKKFDKICSLSRFGHKWMYKNLDLD